MSMNVQDAVREALLRSALTLALFVAGVGPLSAQSHGAVTGVLRAHDGGPLVSVSVQVEGTPLGALTDAQGRYRIEGLPAGQRVRSV